MSKYYSMGEIQQDKQWKRIAQVSSLLMYGFSIPEISQKVGVSEQTIRKVYLPKLRKEYDLEQKKSSEKKKKKSEPKWWHYLIVFGLIYFLIRFFF